MRVSGVAALLSIVVVADCALAKQHRLAFSVPRTTSNNRHKNGCIEQKQFSPILTSSPSCRSVQLPTRGQALRQHYVLHSSSSSNQDHNDDNLEGESSANSDKSNHNNNTNVELPSSRETRRKQIRQKVRQLAKNIVVRPIESVAPMPKAIAEVLKDATVGAVDMVSSQKSMASHNKAMASALSADALVNQAFESAEVALNKAEVSLKEAREALQLAKAQAREAIEAAEDAAVVEATRAVQVAQEAQKVVTQYASAGVTQDVSTLTYDDVGYHFCEDMGPPFLDADMCLIPGEAVARVEKAPENSRRIFAGIDIMASVDDVWKVLTDYEHLQNVVPNLVVNEVMELYNYDKEPPTELKVDSSLSGVEQCQMLSTQMRGAKLRQVGGAKVVGINFSARTTLEVREWPLGMPDFAHFNDDIYEGKSREERAKENSKVKLQRYRFPRPFALSKLPTRDISMQSIQKDDGEFRLYQGVWRMQPLPGCAPQGKQAMRLSYAVEVSPRAYLPVSLVEGRIVQDLCTNLAAIRDFVSDPVLA